MSDHDACLQLLQSYVDSGASAVSCRLGEVTDAFCEAMSETSELRFVIEDVNSKYEMFHALSLNPNIVITEHPEFLYSMMLSQDFLDLKDSEPF